MLCCLRTVMVRPTSPQSSAGIPSPRFAGAFSVKERNLMAVAQCVGDDGRRALEHEVVECAVAGTEVAHADQAQAMHDRVGMEMISGMRAGKQPGIAVSTGA